MKWFAKKPDYQINCEQGIDSIEQISIGGVKQSILIQGEDVSRPVLLFLHGGPSMPTPGVSSRGRDYTIATNTRELVKHFILVFWDQRGTGRSYHPSIPQSSMNLAQFVADTLELTDHLRHRFSQEKIFLVGHSWGSIIGLMAATAYPDRYYSYVGLSQVVNWTENDRLGLAWCKQEAIRRNHRRAIRELEAIGEPPFVESFEQWGVLRKWQRNFGTMIYTDEEIRHPGLASIMMDMIRSKDYSLKDVYHTLVSGFRLVYTKDFILELPSIDFPNTSPEVHIPVTFIHGKHERHVFGSLVEDYFHQLKADRGKRLLWMNKSSHAFHPDDTRLIEQHLIEELRYIQP